ncbi:MAG: hypothetical protein E5Y73_11030 [Mesorhizobium sp.]|uniref:hypothetical protein n=1 Tax=Mesorhizobium sp. TaxID=1871066 RepID=UPI00120CF05E|nr:hypothetical protein [Mesorhizobium sp.]TIL94637.1 MAG: hypothetical protein E5Y73_11030 [Mesorhizobium sp.]
MFRLSEARDHGLLTAATFADRYIVSMSRQSLKHMTADERAEHQRAQSRERMQRKRLKDKPLPVTMTPDLEQFVDRLIAMPLDRAALAMVQWERDNKSDFPDVARPQWHAGITQLELNALDLRWRTIKMIQFSARDAIQRLAAREHRKRFLSKESDEAARLGISVVAYQSRKRAQRQRAKVLRMTQRAKQNTTREVEALPEAHPNFGRF